MGREKSRNAKRHFHLVMLAGLYERMEHYSKEFGWSKTKIIEDAVAVWCNKRDMEVEHGLAKTKQ